MKYRLIILIAALGISVSGIAQHRHEFSVNAGGGISSLQYTAANTTSLSKRLGGEVGLGYHYFFSPNWGVGTGVNVAWYRAQATANTISGSNNALTPAGASFQFTYTYADYKETPKTTMLTIPVMAQFQTTGKTIFYAALGGKIGIPLTASYTSTGALTTTGYFEDINVTYENLPDYGFVTNQATNQALDMDLKVAFMLSAEAGAKWYINDRYNLYTGVYFDYGLNNTNKNTTDANSLVIYQPATPTQFGYNSLASTSNKLVPMAIGVVVRLSFGKGRF